MTTAKQKARLLEAANEDAKHKWPALSAQDAKDAAWKVLVALWWANEGEFLEHYHTYQRQVAMIERAAGFTEEWK